MNGRPIAQGMSAVPQGRQRGRPRAAPWGRQSALGVKELQMHATLKADGSLKSGRSRGYVYYLLNGRQCSRRYVVPKDPRTLRQLRCRAALTVTSNAWSESQRLTEEDREGWRAAAAKVQSRPHLYQQGPLTGQQLFVARNFAREQTGQEMLWELLQPKTQGTGTRRQEREPTSQAPQPKNVARSSSRPSRCCGTNTPRQHRRSPSCAAKSENTIILSQVAQLQRVTRPTWECPRTTTGVPPEWFQCTPGVGRRIGKRGLRPDRSSLVEADRNCHWRELWRGG